MLAITSPPSLNLPKPAARLPAWIVDSPAYQGLRAGVRHTLHCLVEACPHSWGDGGMTGAAGTAQFAASIGISKATLWRHIARLEAHGFLVLVARGGHHPGGNAANKYGIPGQPGGLDDRRRRHRVQNMIKRQDGTFAPLILQPGDQMELFELAPAPPQEEGGG